MAKQIKNSGPSRDQLTDQQWSAASNLFTVIADCKRRLAAKSKADASATV